ncbi:MAG: NYN domain-containing protein [Bacteroidetes bacterium]|nr:NYN domain-containing protein [Bacteroidota bacterium]MBU1113509.1 NYN domain-containing protein [Bacteroidota bacterium]MBU1797041.1 NYN domain-containing protein [Bacteroidota bacterium]
MKRKYIIDGNNLIGKIPKLWNMQKKEKQSSRTGLVFQLERYFHQKKIGVSLHFDGHPNEAIKGKGIKITYSENTTADNKIKDEISITDNPKLITVVSSDQNVLDFARVNSCTIIKSEDFAREMNKIDSFENEEKIAQSISNNEMKKLFGIE